MKNFFLSLLLISQLGFVLSCNNNKEANQRYDTKNSELITKAVVEASDNYTKAIAEVNADKVLSFMYEDLIIIRQQGDPQDKAAFSELIFNLYEGLKIKDVKIEAREINITNNEVMETVEYSESVSIKGAEFIPIKGKYNAWWKKDKNGEWKIYKMQSFPAENSDDPNKEDL